MVTSVTLRRGVDKNGDYFELKPKDTPDQQFNMCLKEVYDNCYHAVSFLM